MTCTGAIADGKNYIEVGLTQAVGRFKISGMGTTQFTCDGATYAWSAQVPGDNGRFGGGKAQLSGRAFACSDTACAYAEFNRTVTLKK